MPYFAEIDNENIVQQVVSVSQQDAPDPAPNDEAGNQFLHSIGLSGRWVQTSYNNNFRGHYAGIGDSYDKILDLFIAPQPFPSWLMLSNGHWEPPKPCPTDGKKYYWDESIVDWIEVTE